jgi:D-alanyl-D-alanine carboxypeptidase (penicillin-binding protein 5/6)
VRVSRRRIAALLGVAYLCVALLPSAALAATVSKPSVTVPAAILTTMDGQRLWSHNRNDQRRVASTIKMLNALVVRERTSLDDVVTISAKAARTEDGVGLVKGQKVTVRKLLQLMMVVSSNDAAEALAIHVSGTEKKHVERMNAKARQLGLYDTHAIDPHGLSKREHSTARDLSVLGRAVMADPVLRKTVLMRRVVLYRPHHKAKTLKATDEMLGHYYGIEGIKTGFTYAAGYCFVGAAKRGNLELVGVVLGAKSNPGRFTQMHKLLDWGFARYRMRRLVSTTTTMGVVQVSNGASPSVTVHASREASRAVLATGAPVVTRIKLPETPVSAPIRRGDQLGVVSVSQNGAVLASVALLADSDVASATVPSTVSAQPSASPSELAAAPRPSLWERLGGLPRRALVALASTL